MLSLIAESLCLTLITGVGLLDNLAALLPQLHPQRLSNKMRCITSDRFGQLVAQQIKSGMSEGTIKRGERRTTRGQTVHMFI